MNTYTLHAMTNKVYDIVNRQCLYAYAASLKYQIPIDEVTLGQWQAMKYELCTEEMTRENINRLFKERRL